MFPAPTTLKRPLLKGAAMHSMVMYNSEDLPDQSVPPLVRRS